MDAAHRRAACVERGHRVAVIEDSYQDFGAGQFIWRLGDPAVEGYVAAERLASRRAGGRLLTRDLPAVRRRRRRSWPGLALAMAGSIAFSGKAIIVKLAYRHGVDAVTLIMYRMLFALPLFAVLAWWAGRGKPALTRRDWLVVSGLGFSGYYLASFLDFAGLAYITASLERLILYLNPTLVLRLGVVVYKRRGHARQLVALAVSYCGVLRRLRPRARRSRAATPRSAAAPRLRQRAELCGLPGAQRRGGEAPRRPAPDRAGDQRGLPLCIAQFLLLRPVSAFAVAPEVIWLSLLNATAAPSRPC